MEERNRPEEEQEAQEEYSFLQEVIKDEAGSRKKLKNDIVRIISFGFIFGIVACFSFYAFRPWIERQFEGGPEQVTIPKDEEEEEEQKPEEEVKEEERPVLDTNSYREMLQSLKGVAKETNKSVVEISGVTGDGDWVKELSDSSRSISGIIVADNSRELLVLGKMMPARDAERILITFADGEKYEAAVKRQESSLGLCVYAVPREKISMETWAGIEIATLGSSNAVGMGDTAIVLGKPFGYANAVSYGIVASDRTYMELSDGQFSIIYTDIAGASAGSGVIANIRGEIIGIIDQKILEEDSRNQIAGYGISDIKDMIELLSNGAGVPYTGLCGVDVTEEMEAEEFPKGIYVTEVEADSPAMAAGIQSGDIITSVDESETSTVSGYHAILMKKIPGNKITLKGCRQGTGGEYVDIDFNVVVGTKE